MSDSQSIIFHIDVNSAFLSWSAVKLLSEGSKQDLREIPSIVGGDRQTRHGIVIAKSIPAKKYGIQTAETVADAFKKCPHLVMVPPDHRWYSKQSQLLMDLLSSICPVIEQVSIDECYMDFEPIRSRFASPEEAASAIRDTVRDSLGFTVNVGISDRKVLAKMASDFQKPDRVHTLYSYEIQEKMWPLPVEDLYMCGKSACSRLKTMGIRTIGDLAQADDAAITAALKSHGKRLQEYARGIDASVVNPVREKAKGVGNSTTLSQDVTDAVKAHQVLKELAASVSGRLQKKQVLAASISVEIKYADFTSVSHQGPIRESNREEIIYRESVRLFDTRWNGAPIRLLGIRATKLSDEGDPVQLNLFDFQREQEALEQQKKEAERQKRTAEKQKKAGQAMETIRKKYGNNAIRKGF